MKIIILGANGMLGNACMNHFTRRSQFRVKGTIRNETQFGFFKSNYRDALIPNVDITCEQSQRRLLLQEKPDVVINCVGLVKQAQDSSNCERQIKLNALLPHQLKNSCNEFGAKLIQISTDCVFSGLKGLPYLESDHPDAGDLYGKTKLLGEIYDDPNVLTIRTSYIGNELHSKNGLLEWFLAQNQECKGFTRAIYSGIPTVILVEVIENILLNYPDLNGLYHVSSSPISKFELLSLIRDVFAKKIDIIPSDDLVINRSLDCYRFREATGFVAPSWREMIERMYLDRIKNVQK